MSSDELAAAPPTRRLRVAFCQHFFYEYLGLMTLSAVLERQGHAVEVFIDDLGPLVEAVRESRFDLVCFTVMSGDADWAVAGARALKEAAPAVPVVMGGPHCTFFPEFLDAHPEIDACCVGEGEGALSELAEAVAAGRDFSDVRNLVVRSPAGDIRRNPLRPLVDDLDSLPFPDRHVYAKYRYFTGSPVRYLMASRGCPYDCSFCFNHRYKALYQTNRFRLRSAENILAEIDHLVAQGMGDANLVFVDSTINLDADWCEDFFRKYGERVQARFSVNMAAGQINERIVRALAATGKCQSVNFAVEVGDERMRRELLRKQLSNAQVRRATALLRQSGIKVYVFVMFGLPFETADTALETVRFCQEVRPDFLKPALFVPYRGLDITRTALDHGFLLPEDLERLGDRRFSSMESLLRLADLSAIKILFYFSILLIHFPWLTGAVRRLSRGRALGIYRLVFLLSFVLQSRAFFSMPLRRTLVELAHHRREA